MFGNAGFVLVVEIIKAAMLKGLARHGGCLLAIAADGGIHGEPCVVHGVAETAVEKFRFRFGSLESFAC